MKKVVISLGGSVMLPPGKVDTAFLKKFKEHILPFTKTHIIILVTGGGNIARIYIEALRDKPTALQSMMGISITRLNAKFLYNFFNLPFPKLPHTLKDVENLTKKHALVICGALRYEPNQTSDGTAAEIARYLKADCFINLTNVDGLYTKDPRLKGAKLIPEMSTQDFYNLAKKMTFHAGQHFVLDTNAAKIINDKKIPTYIVGPDLDQLANILKGKKFKGTLLRV